MGVTFVLSGQLFVSRPVPHSFFHFLTPSLSLDKMGANSSRESTGSTTSGASSPQKYSDLVDLGSLLPCGIYPNSPQDYDYRSIRKLIIDRRIAPFYKGTPSRDSLPVSLLHPSFYL